MRKNNETALVYSCIDYLTKVGIPCWRNNSGALRKGKHLIKFGQPGSPDILGILPPNGRLLGVECKMPGNEITDLQGAWLSRACEAGAAVIVVYTIDELMNWVDAGMPSFKKQLDAMIAELDTYTTEYRV